MHNGVLHYGEIYLLLLLFLWKALSLQYLTTRTPRRCFANSMRQCCLRIICIHNKNIAISTAVITCWLSWSPHPSLQHIRSMIEHTLSCQPNSVPIVAMQKASFCSITARLGDRIDTCAKLSAAASRRTLLYSRGQSLLVLRRRGRR